MNLSARSNILENISNVTEMIWILSELYISDDSDFKEKKCRYHIWPCGIMVVPELIWADVPVWF